jgi:hypothetical protein
MERRDTPHGTNTRKTNLYQIEIITGENRYSSWYQHKKNKFVSDRNHHWREDILLMVPTQEKQICIR